MDMMKMLGQLQESQRKVEEAKIRLSNEVIQETTSDNLMTVNVFKNGRIQEVLFKEELLQDKEQLIDYLILTINKALDKAQAEFDSEIERVAKDGLPQIPGMPF
ncbi:MAG: YbaB/EbfC family nucleoid-associated protein [Flavobacteriaceae bacterium]|nr:YbaB/EbfC family nucleoid-associated protein [Flavobacteriaceae bacterium]